MVEKNPNLPEKIIKMGEVGRVAAQIMQELIEYSVIGRDTLSIDQFAGELIEKYGAQSMQKGYRPGFYIKPFPGNICVGTNEVVTHGIGSKDIILKDGDLVSIDLTIKKDGYCADMARSFILGKGSEEAEKLLAVTTEALNIAMKAAKSGATTGDVGHAVQPYVEENGFSVVRELVGHTIGKNMHEDPLVPAYGKPNNGPILEKYHTIAMDTLVNVGTHEVKFDKKDGWTVRTADGKLSCLMEDTFYVDDEGGVPLTRV